MYVYMYKQADSNISDQKHTAIKDERQVIMMSMHLQTRVAHTQHGLSIHIP